MGVEKVVVVTDSTCGLPDAEVARLGIVVVPVLVVIDHESLREGIDITPSEVADRLRSGSHLTTSRPSPEHFLAAYTRAAQDGATGVVSVHLSTELSGTCQAAMLAARRSPIPVEVVDTKTVAMAAGYAVIDAAEAAERGESPGACAAAARTTARQSRAYFYVDTLEYLRRGGRIGAAQRYVGQALQMKPLLGMSEGGVVPLEKVRTAAKALTRLVDLAVARCTEIDQPRLAVQHLQAQESADRVTQDLVTRVPGAPCLESDIGAVLGVHTGPGLVAVMVVPRGGHVTDGPVWWQLLVAAAGGFLAGSINPATLLARARGMDIHQLGSGNPGATNTARALGKRAGILVGVLDILKGFIPVVLFSLWSPQAGAVAGLAAVLGHVFSPFLNWKGGKGVATTLGVVLGMQPWWAVPMLLVFGVTVAVTKRVGIGAVAAAVVLVAIGIWFTDSRVESFFTITLALIVIIRHRRNIMELFTGVSHIGDDRA